MQMSISKKVKVFEQGEKIIYCLYHISIIGLSIMTEEPFCPIKVNSNLISM